MPTVTLSSKNQITLPVDIVRDLGLKGGDKLLIIQSGDHLALFPRPTEFTDSIVGSMKGTFGSTKEEIDRYIAEVRYGWDIGALQDALAVDEQLRAVYDALPPNHDEGLSLSQIAERSGVDRGYADQFLERLETLHAVKRLKHPVLKAEPYYRRLP